MILRDSALTSSKTVKDSIRSKTHINDKDTSRDGQIIKVDSTTQLHRQITISSVMTVHNISNEHRIKADRRQLLIKTIDNNKALADTSSGKHREAAFKDNEVDTEVNNLTAAAINASIQTMINNSARQIHATEVAIAASKLKMNFIN